jgi:hypothetical protein
MRRQLHEMNACPLGPCLDHRRFLFSVVVLDKKPWPMMVVS